MKLTSIAIFASGTGSNAENLIRFFKNHPQIAVKLVVSNKSDAAVIQKAQNLGVETVFLPNTAFVDGQELINLLRQHEIEWIVLAGFLRKISPELIAHFPNHIINIHPSLLPKYGGKGMYGMHVHEAVIAAKESTSGITIHLVNEEFDKGAILAQYTTNLSNSDTPATLAQKIHALEHQFFPIIVEQTIQKSQP